MARIHAREEAGEFFDRDDLRDSRGDSPYASSLPVAIARVHDSTRPGATRMVELEVTPERPEDIPSGFLQKINWFFLDFGRFANGVLPHWSAQSFLLSLMLMAISLMAWFYPLLNTQPMPPLSLFEGFFFIKLLLLPAWGAVTMLVCGSAALYGITYFFGGRMSLLAAMRILLTAFMPLNLFLAVILMLGMGEPEAFFRGNLPPVLPDLMKWLVPVFCFWGSFRVCAAIKRHGLVQGISPVLMVMSLTALCWVLQIFWPGWRYRSMGGEAWKEMMAAGEHAYVLRDHDAAMDALEKAEKWMPYFEADARIELYVLRMELEAAAGDLQGARADALRLQHLSHSDSSSEHLARGANYIIQGYVDKGVDELRLALDRDRDNVPALRWLARVSRSTDPDRALGYGRRAYQADSSLAEFCNLVDLYHEQGEKDEIWNLMMEVEFPLDDWPARTLFQGGMAAHDLNKQVRAALLLKKAVDSDPSLKEELPIEL